jgi:hypothetical protein
MKRASHLIFIVALIHTLTVVSIFVPAALSIREGEALPVEAIDLATPICWNETTEEYYGGPNPFFSEKLDSSLQERGVSNLTPPENCGPTCKYSFYFQAPAIQCSEPMYISGDSNSEIPTIEFPTIYRSTNNISNSTRNRSPTQLLGMNLTWFNITNEDDLLLVQNGQLPATTIWCEFYYAQYRANVTWTEQGRQLETQISYYLYNLYSHQSPLYLSILQQPLFCPRQNSVYCNAIAFVDAFSSSFQGEATALAIDGNNFTINSQSNKLKHTLENFFLDDTDSGSMRFYMPYHYSSWEYGWPIFDYPQTLLNYALEVFLNVSKFSISTSFQEAALYKHSQIYLWAFYGSAIGASTIVSIIAMTLVYLHGAPSAKGFSHLLVMTRNTSLIRIVQEAPLGAHQLTDNTQDINLRFGKLKKRYDNDIEMVGFGIDKEDAVSPLTQPKAVELW